jgi:hypothetical protein
MKRCYMLCALLLLFALPLQAGTITKTVTFQKSNLTFSKANGYDVVELKGYPSLIKPGAPRVPRVVIPLCIPAGTTPQKVEIVSQNVVDIKGTYNLYPAQPDIPLPMPGKNFIPDEEIPPNPDIYLSSNLYPETEIKVNGYGTKSGYRIAHIEMYPLRYRPQEGKLQLTTTITFRVEYSYAHHTEPTVLTPRQQEVFGETVRKIVENPEDVSSFSPRVSERKTPSFLPAGYYEYVVISEDPMDTVFQRLADWKTKKGVPATVVTVSWITSNYSGYDTPEKIRNFIIDAYNEWGTIYVLLGGSGDQKTSGEDPVPDRRAWYITSGVGYYSDEDWIPCDLYYSDMDGDWDADNDNTYGETGDNVDMYADVYVGRASVYNVSMAQNFVYKTLTYEMDPPPVYIKKLMLPTGILWSSYEERPMQDSIADMAPGDWQVSKMYERNGNLSRQGMIDTMNVGYQLGHWEGHGNEDGIYYEGGSTAFLTSGDADGLINGDKVGIANSIACFCGAWDETPGDDCFSEHLNNRVGGGLLGVMMNSRYGWGAYVSGYVPGPSERLDTTFYYNIFYNHIYNLGETHAVAKDAWVPYVGHGQEYEYTRWCIYELNLLGCPEVPIWTDTPDSMTVTHNSTIPMGTTDFDVTVREDDGVTPIANALVCLMGKTDTGLYGTGYTNASGNVAINVSASTPLDTMWVTATAHNHYPYQGYAIVLDAGMPEVPTVISPFNFAKLPDTQPELQFYSTDPQSDDLKYVVLWDTDPGFSSPASDTTVLYASGEIVTFTLPSPLTDGETYWWKVKCTDPGGSGIWTQSTAKRSFTIDISLPEDIWAWFQTTAAQFEYCALNGIEIEGDSLVISLSTQTTILQQGFESTTFPPTGWAKFAGPGNGSTNDWARQTNQSHSGSASAGIEYDSDNTVDRFLATENLNLSSVANTELVFWHRDNWASYYVYHGIWASTVSQTNPDDYSQVIETGPTSEDTWEQFMVDLSAYDGSNSVYFAFRYNEYNGTDWWIDDILIRGNTQGDSGTATSTPIAYIDFPVRKGWDKARWTQSTGSDSIKLQLEYKSSGIWSLIPDGALPGNSSGFFTNTQTGEVDISVLDTTTYDTLRLVANLYKSSIEPSLLDWEVGVLGNIENVPPEPFSLLSPPDSTLFANPRPSFIWESTYDTESGLKDYNVYIEGILRHTGIDTTWTADYDLAEGYNDWYVVARDSVNNGRQSNETWTVIIDTEPPSVVNLISPPDNGYVNNSTVAFTWHESDDNVSGVDHYVLQYALDSGFSTGLVETTTVDTVFTANLPDTIYYWHVKAVDVVANESAFSSTWQFEVDTDVPAAPILTSPVGGVWLTNTSVNFQWSTVTVEGKGRKLELSSRKKIDNQFGSDWGEKISGNPFLDNAGEPPRVPLSPIKYVIQVDTTTGFSSPVFIDTLTSTSTNTILNEDIYYWRVRAFDLAGNEGPFSSTENFGVDVTPPSTVSLVSPDDNSYVNTSTINFTWNQADDNLSGVDYYVLQYALDSGFSTGLVETTTVDTTFTANLPDTIYYWHVKAVDVATNEGSYSSTWQFEVDTDVPAAPTLTSPVGGVWLTNTSVDFQWSAVTFGGNNNQKKLGFEGTKGQGGIPLSPVRYVFQVDTNSSFASPIVVDTLTTNSTNETLSEDIYYWRVRAYDLAGNEGPFSSTENFGVDVTSPVIESTTVWTDTIYTGPFEISTRVTDNLSGLDSVLLYYMRDEDPDWVTEIMHQSGDWFLDSIPAVTYSNDTVRYYIRAIDIATNESTDPDGAPGTYYSFVANLTGVAESADLPQQFNFKVSSLVKGYATFKFAIPKTGSVNLKIYDVTGRLIVEPLSGNIECGRFQILFKPARSGIFFYKLESQFENRTGKIVIF